MDAQKLLHAIENGDVKAFDTVFNRFDNTQDSEELLGRVRELHEHMGAFAGHTLPACWTVFSQSMEHCASPSNCCACCLNRSSSAALMLDNHIYQLSTPVRPAFCGVGETDQLHPLAHAFPLQFCF